MYPLLRAGGGGGSCYSPGVFIERQIARVFLLDDPSGRRRELASLLFRRGPPAGVHPDVIADGRGMNGGT